MAIPFHCVPGRGGTPRAGVFPRWDWVHGLPRPCRERSRIGRGLARARPGRQVERGAPIPTVTAAAGRPRHVADHARRLAWMAACAAMTGFGFGSPYAQSVILGLVPRIHPSTGVNLSAGRCGNRLCHEPRPTLRGTLDPRDRPEDDKKRARPRPSGLAAAPTECSVHPASAVGHLADRGRPVDLAGHRLRGRARTALGVVQDLLQR